MASATKIRAVQSKTIRVQLPVKGIHLGTPRHVVPEGYSPDMNNVFVYDIGERARMGQRPGSSKYFGTTQFGGGAKFGQLMHQCTIEISGARVDYIFVAFGGKLYLQKPSDVSAVRVDDTGAGAAVFSPGRRVEAATFENVTYFTDGLVLRKYTHTASVSYLNFTAWTASHGLMPVTVTPRYCRLLCIWRGRMVQALLDDASPEDVFFSKQGDPSDYDYSVTPNAAMPFVIDENYRAGQIGQPVTALIPFNNDKLLIGLDHSLYMMLGDPADGGTLLPISDSIGILTQDSWCVRGNTVYFMGPDGFYSWSGEDEPTNLSRDIYNSIYSNLPRKGYFVNVRFDQSRQGIFVFVTKSATPFTTHHSFLDLRTGALLPISFSINTGGDDTQGSGGTGAPTYGPTKALYYDGGDATTDDAAMLIACRDGYVRKIDTAAVGSDDGTAISSYLNIAPFNPGGQGGRVMINGWYPTLGETGSTNCNWTIKAAEDAYNALANPVTTRTGTFTSSGRQSPRGERITGSSFALKFDNSTLSKAFDLEDITMIAQQAGRVR